MRTSTVWFAAATVAASVTVFALAQDPAAPTTLPTTAPAPGTATTEPTTAPTTQETLTRLSYGLGYDMGRGITENMKQAGVQLDEAVFLQAIQDAMAGTPAKFSENQIRAAFEVIQKDIAARQQEAAEKQEALDKVAAEKAQAEGIAFLVENKAKPNIKTTASGLQYEITQEGTGPTPKSTDTVKVHYTGTLLDGKKFDSSVDRGEPIEFPLDGVIPGWTEGLQLLKVGGKARLYIPSALGYGPRGQGPIPPNSVLIFDVELLGITPADAPAAMPGAMPPPAQMP